MSKLWSQISSKTRAIECSVIFKSTIRAEILSRRVQSECDCDYNCLDDVLNYVQN